MMCAMGCLFIHHSFKTMELSVDLTHVAFCETEDSSANEERRKLTWTSALNQKPTCIKLFNANFTNIRESYSTYEEIKVYKS